jgi:hypothetical protein
MNTRIMCVMAMGALLAACGGSSSSSSGSKFKDPNSVDFTYGAKADTASTPYDDAAGVAAVTGEAAAEGTTGDLMTDLTTGFVFAGGPLAANMMVFDGLDLSMFTTSPVLQDPRMAILSAAGARLVGATDPADPALKASVDCQIAIDDTGLDVDHCKASFTYTEDKVSDAASASLSGKFSRGADAMTWSFKLSVGADLVDDTYSLGGDLYGELKGDLALDAAAVPPTFAGYSRVSYSVDLKQADTADTTQDGTFTAAVTDQEDLALTLTITDTDKCVNGGTVTLKRVWTTLPAGTGIWDTTGSTITDQAAIITFTAPTAPAVCSTAAEYQVGTVAATP